MAVFGFECVFRVWKERAVFSAARAFVEIHNNCFLNQNKCLFKMQIRSCQWHVVIRQNNDALFSWCSLVLIKSFENGTMIDHLVLLLWLNLLNTVSLENQRTIVWGVQGQAYFFMRRHN